MNTREAGQARGQRSPGPGGLCPRGPWLWILAAAALAAAGVLALQSCGDYSLYTALEVEENAAPLELSAGTEKLALPLTVPLTLSVTGGVPPFEPSLEGAGTLTADPEVPGNSLLIYRAPDSIPGEEATATIQVRDFVGKRTTASVRVHRPLSVEPGISFSIHRGGTQELTVSGGVRPYEVSAAQGGTVSPGTIDGSYRYTCPRTGMSDEIQVRDAVGTLRTVAVRIVDPPSPGELSLDPPSAVIGVGESASFVVSGGTPPYGPPQVSGGGSVTVSGSTFTYTAPAIAVSATVTVTDSASPPASADFTVQVLAPPSPLAATFDGNLPSGGQIKVVSGQTVTVAVSGGISPYSVTVLSLLPAQGTVSGADPGPWTYAAPAVSHTEHETIVVTDSGGSVVYQLTQIKP